MELWGRYRDLGYLENHDGACDYEDMQNQTDIEAYKVSAKDNIARKRRGRGPRTVKRFLGKMQWAGWGGGMVS